MRHWDRLYGQSDLQESDLEIYQTPQFARLIRVSLSAIPTWTQPTGLCASKAEHSRGVRHLAKILAELPEYKDDAVDLILAATLHDVGTPPFSHLSEQFQKTVCGKDHEEFCEEIIFQPELLEVVRRQGGDPERITRLITGEEKPLSDVINGTIDIDNLDNTLRFGLSMGLIREKMYDPEQMVRQFTKLSDNSIALREEMRSEVKEWESCRSQIYAYVYGNENLCAAAMVHRAIQFALLDGILRKDYFQMTDESATAYLLEKGDERTQQLLNDALRWRFYPLIAAFEYQIDDKTPRAALSLSLTWKGKKYLADKIAKELGIRQEHVCVFVGQDKGVKKIHLPFVEGDLQLGNHESVNKQRVVAKIFINPKVPANKQEVKSTVQALLEGERIEEVESS